MSRSRSAYTVVALAVGAVLLALSAPALAEERKDYPNEFGFVGGLAFGDKDIAGGDWEGRFAPAVGLRYGHMLGEHTGLFADGVYSPFQTANLPDVDMATLRLGVEWLFDPWKSWRWAVNAGAGWTGLHFSDTMTDFDRPIVSVGFGQRRAMDGRQFFRWEIRCDQSLGDDIPGTEETLLTVYGLLGITWGFGGPPPDADGDGVPDRKDECPDTPHGAQVTERGCPLDSDGDGVFDGLDRCPDTPKGWPVDAKGCPLDSDGDGVADGADQCPNTPKGAKVDAKGCPSDADGDGVYDGLDQCANTPKGVKVDAKGCPLDSDGDGVFDGVDQCPGTPKGTKVDAKGCPVEEKPAPAPLFTATQKELVLEGVNFENNSAKLTAEATFVLDKVADSLLYYKDIRVEVGGHTDSKGSDAYNQKLSEARAKSVMDYLVSKGIAASRMTAKGYGEKQPIADNATDAGRAKNRRVALKQLG